MYAQMRGITLQHLSGSFDELMGGLKVSEGAALLEADDMRRCFFGDYLDPGVEPTDRL